MKSYSLINTFADSLTSKKLVGNQRTILAKKNIFASFLVKGISMLISLMLVPLTINYINPTQYGIWLTLSSVIAWFSFFDIGFAGGLRNKFAEAKAKGNLIIARKYVSTTYAALSLIFAIVLLIFIITNYFIDWSILLNTPKELSIELSRLALVVVSFFCIQSILKIVNIILIADQRPAISALFDMLGQLFALIIIYILTKTTEGSLIYLGTSLGLIPILVLITSSLILYNKRYKDVRPSFRFVEYSYAKDIIGLGYKFFIIQIAGIVQFQTSIFIIAHFFGSLDVTNYSIAYKLFGVISMVFAIFTTPFWSAVTEAFYKNEYSWIRESVKQYLKLWFVIGTLGCICLIFSDPLYDLWIGKGVMTIDFRISLWIYLYFLILTFGSIFVNVLNGIGAIKIQFFSSIISPFIFLISSILLIKTYNLGVYSVIIASIIANFNGLILAPLQYRKVFIKHSKGIWVK